MSRNENYSYLPESDSSPGWTGASVIRRARFSVRTEYLAEFELSTETDARPGTEAARAGDGRVDAATAEAVRAGMNERSLFFASHGRA